MTTPPVTTFTSPHLQQSSSYPVLSSSPSGSVSSPNINLTSNSVSSPPHNPNSDSKETPISLKVMRLCQQPMFLVEPPLLSEKEDLLSSATLYDDRSISQSSFGLSETLLLPSSFGNVYLGEIFRSYISINNSSNAHVSSVGLKVELQTPSNRVVLLELSKTSIPIFSPGDSQDFVVAHEILQEGLHILVCTTSYIRFDGEKKNIRKFYKFQVDQPLLITNSTRLFKNEVYMEVQVKNASKSALFIEHASFNPTSFFTVVDLNKEVSDSHLHSHSILKSIRFLKPGQIHQFLFHLLPTSDLSKKVSGIGNMKFTWRSHLGGIGKLQTPLIERQLPIIKDFELKIVDIPSQIELETPFTVKIQITNCSDQKLKARLTATLEKQIGIMINGVYGKEIKYLEPKQYCFITLSFFPVLPGIQQITGLKIIDQSDRHHLFDDLCDVFVSQGNSSLVSSPSSSSSLSSSSSNLSSSNQRKIDSA